MRDLSEAQGSLKSADSDYICLLKVALTEGIEPEVLQLYIEELNCVGRSLVLLMLTLPGTVEAGLKYSSCAVSVVKQAISRGNFQYRSELSLIFLVAVTQILSPNMGIDRRDLERLLSPEGYPDECPESTLMLTSIIQVVNWSKEKNIEDDTNSLK